MKRLIALSIVIAALVTMLTPLGFAVNRTSANGLVLMSDGGGTPIPPVPPHLFDGGGTPIPPVPPHLV